MHRLRISNKLSPDQRCLLGGVLLSLAFLWPAFFGQSLIVDDNYLQNAPLRVLAGHIWASGHLPLWDPYIWSGTPLLAGFNAGAADPRIVLFAVLPPVLAWLAFNFVIYYTAWSGTYLLVREIGTSCGPALLAATAFSFGGFMALQQGHIGDVAGASLFPWVLLALRRLERDSRWVGVAIIALGWVFLSGSPEPMVYIVMFSVGYIVYRYLSSKKIALSVTTETGRRHLDLAWQHGLNRNILTKYIVVFVGALLLGSIQLLPGLAFISASQRSQISYAFFGSYSVLKADLFLLVNPYLWGGWGTGIYASVARVGLPTISGASGYVGIGVLGFALATFFSRSPVATETDADWWKIMAVLGLLFAMGTGTPLGHLLYQIPLYGKMRVQGRNLLEFDLAISVLAALWFEKMLQSRRSHFTWWMAGLPSVGALLLWFAVVVDRSGLISALAWRFPRAALESTFQPASVAVLVPACLGAAFLLILSIGVCLRDRRVWTWLVLGFCIIDLGFFSDGLYWTASPSPTAVMSASSTTNYLSSHLDGQRFASYNPQLAYASATQTLDPDLNIWFKLQSVMGYGSLVSEAYQASTGTHSLDSMDVAVLTSRQKSLLDLKYLVVPAAYLVAPYPNFSAALVAGLGSTSLSNQAVASFPLGAAETVTSVEMVSFLANSIPLQTGDVVGYLEAVGVTGSVLHRWPIVIGRDTAEWAIDRPSLAGIIHQTKPPVFRSWPVSGGYKAHDYVGTFSTSTPLRGVTGFRVVANLTIPTSLDVQALAFSDGTQVFGPGSLAWLSTSPVWRLATSIGPIDVFQNLGPLRPAWLENVSGHISSTAVTVVSEGSQGQGMYRVIAQTRSWLVRSESFLPGWVATVNGHPVPVVSKDHYLQAVLIPAGRDVVRFSYRPRSVLAGSLLSLVGFLVAISWLVPRWRFGLASLLGKLWR